MTVHPHPNLEPIDYLPVTIPNLFHRSECNKPGVGSQQATSCLTPGSCLIENRVEISPSYPPCTFPPSLPQKVGNLYVEGFFRTFDLAGQAEPAGAQPERYAAIQTALRFRNRRFLGISFGHFLKSLPLRSRQGWHGYPRPSLGPGKFGFKLQLIRGYISPAIM